MTCTICKSLEISNKKSKQKIQQKIYKNSEQKIHQKISINFENYDAESYDW